MPHRPSRLAESMDQLKEGNGTRFKLPSEASQKLFAFAFPNDQPAGRLQLLRDLLYGTLKLRKDGGPQVHTERGPTNETVQQLVVSEIVSEKPPCSPADRRRRSGQHRNWTV